SGNGDQRDCSREALYTESRFAEAPPSAEAEGWLLEFIELVSFSGMVGGTHSASGEVRMVMPGWAGIHAVRMWTAAP
ncbi:MAG TPA: hypothetical protein PLG17_06115, partial [Thermodesulfobacteriota bacterium]|nr:hypothetical protein [Thermodesulfobacteriota bacterium]